MRQNIPLKLQTQVEYSKKFLTIVIDIKSLMIIYRIKVIKFI